MCEITAKEIFERKEERSLYDHSYCTLFFYNEFYVSPKLNIFHIKNKLSKKLTHIEISDSIINDKF